jgi:hypothetical protein
MTTLRALPGRRIEELATLFMAVERIAGSGELTVAGYLRDALLDAPGALDARCDELEQASAVAVAALREVLGETLPAQLAARVEQLRVELADAEARLADATERAARPLAHAPRAMDEERARRARLDALVLDADQVIERIKRVTAP